MNNTHPKPKIELFPWDHTSPEHVERMHRQRIACGWRVDEVEKWQAMSRRGTKVLYWIVSRLSGSGVDTVMRQSLTMVSGQALALDCMDRDGLLLKHTTKYPKVKYPEPP